MRIGCTLPTFTDDPEDFLRVARQAEEAGLDGVFSFEHLWPMGQPGRPAFPGKLALAAVASVTSRIAVGTLVARVGLVPDDTLLSEMEALEEVSGGRLIAGIGVGDRLSDDENAAYGLAHVSAEDRIASLDELVAGLVAREVDTWVGAGSGRTNDIARAHAVPLNLWAVDVGVVGAAAALGEVTWGGPITEDPEAAAATFREVAAAGATFLVWAWPPSPALVASVAGMSGVQRG